MIAKHETPSERQHTSCGRCPLCGERGLQHDVQSPLPQDYFECPCCRHAWVEFRTSDRVTPTSVAPKGHLLHSRDGML